MKLHQDLTISNANNVCFSRGELKYGEQEKGIIASCGKHLSSSNKNKGSGIIGTCFALKEPRFTPLEQL